MVLILCRGVIFSTALVLWGAAAVRWRLWPGATALRGEGVMVGALSLAVAVLLPVQVARAGFGWADAADGDMVLAVLTQTGLGHSWAVQALGAAGLLSGLLTGRRRAGFAALVLVGQALSGHAAAGAGLTGLLRQANDVVHLLAAGAWLGALPYVLRLLPRRDAEARSILIRYSGQGHLWVALVLLTGTVAALWTTGLPRFPAPPYQALLWAKIAVTAAMVGLALHNRYVLVPRLAADLRAGAAIARATRTEILLGLSATALVAVFGTLEPM